jgi:hypothetical protein
MSQLTRNYSDSANTPASTETHYFDAPVAIFNLEQGSGQQQQMSTPSIYSQEGRDKPALTIAQAATTAAIPTMIVNDTPIFADHQGIGTGGNDSFTNGPWNAPLLSEGTAAVSSITATAGPTNAYVQPRSQPATLSKAGGPVEGIDQGAPNSHGPSTINDTSMTGSSAYNEEAKAVEDLPTEKAEKRQEKQEKKVEKEVGELP